MPKEMAEKKKMPFLIAIGHLLFGEKREGERKEK